MSIQIDTFSCLLNLSYPVAYQSTLGKCQVNGKSLNTRFLSVYTPQMPSHQPTRQRKTMLQPKPCFLILLANYKLFSTAKFLQSRVKHLQKHSTSTQQLNGCSGNKQRPDTWHTHCPHLGDWLTELTEGSPQSSLAWLWKWPKAPESYPWCSNYKKTIFTLCK